MRRFAVKVFLGIGILCYLLIILFSRGFYSIFSPNDPELIDFAASKSIPYFCGFFLAGYNILMISYWQSMQKNKKCVDRFSVPQYCVACDSDLASPVGFRK